MSAEMNKYSISSLQSRYCSSERGESGVGSSILFHCCQVNHAAAHRDLDFIEEADLVFASGRDIVSTLSFLELNKRTQTGLQTLKKLPFVYTMHCYAFGIENILQAV